ncbi:MAG: excinuclease ABC subunit C [Proteobacteria bacterium]|nr:excinuclease ABC subunit C [Pseudomonadota bacterium]
MANSTKFNPNEFIDSMPNLPGVYRMTGRSKQLLYVGKSIDLKKRVSSYFRSEKKLSPRIRLMVRQVNKIDITVTRSESEALLLENNLIKTLKPKYNILYRDDKSYPYVAFSKHKFPRLHLYRGSAKEGGRYFGPFSNSKAVRESIHLLQKVFKLRTCENSVFSNRVRPCLLYQIKRCSGPCVRKISENGYKDTLRDAQLFLNGKHNQVINKLENRMEIASRDEKYELAGSFRDQIFALQQIREHQYVATTGMSLDADIVAIVKASEMICVNVVMIRNGDHRGDKSFFPKNIFYGNEDDALSAFLAQHYIGTQVPATVILNRKISVNALQEVLSQQLGKTVRFIRSPIGRKRVWMEMAQKNAEISLGQRLSTQINQERRLVSLNDKLSSIDIIKRIECFDVSHMQGEATVASCVVYDNKAMQPSEYRKFNISNVTPGDDYGAISQVIERRYVRLIKEDGKIPDLIMVDGGKGQVNGADKVLKEIGLNQIGLIGIAKGLERKPGFERIVFPNEAKPLTLGETDPALHLIQEIRDEAHRFAIQGHRGRRNKARIRSALEDIEGVGNKRRQRLIVRFGGIKGVSSASIQELQSVEGISNSLAKKIYDELH